MMKNIVADTSYKGASNSTHPSASHHHKVNITLFNHTTNGLARFTTMEFNLNIHLKNKHDLAFNDSLSTVTGISAMKLNLHTICWVANHFQQIIWVSSQHYYNRYWTSFLLPYSNTCKHKPMAFFSDFSEMLRWGTWNYPRHLLGFHFFLTAFLKIAVWIRNILFETLDIQHKLYWNSSIILLELNCEIIQNLFPHNWHIFCF